MQNSINNTTIGATTGAAGMSRTRSFAKTIQQSWELTGVLTLMASAAAYGLCALLQLS
jgi:hypothetical protein